MKCYEPTEAEINALFIIAPFLYDSISVNKQYFYDDDTDDNERKIIYASIKNIYKSCLNIYDSNKLFPFA